MPHSEYSLDHLDAVREIGLDPWQTWGGRCAAGGLLLAGAGAVASVPLMNGGLLLALIGTLLGRVPIHRLPGFLPATLLALWMVISTTLSPWGPFDIPGWAYSWIALYVWAGAVSRIRLELLFRILLGSGVVVVVLALLQFTVGYLPGAKPLRLGLGPEAVRFDRASGLYSHHIRFGDGIAVWSAWIAALAPCCLAGPWGRVVQAGGLVLGLAGVTVSSARSALPALFAGWWGVLAGSCGLRRILLGSAALGLAGALAIGLFFHLWPSRMAGLVQGQDGRAAIWADAWHAFRADPWTGVGNGGYNAAATAARNDPQYAGTLPPYNHGEDPAMGHAHSSYLGLLVQDGIPGAVLYAWWLGAVAWACWRRRRNHPAVLPLLFGTLGAVLVGGLAEDLVHLASPRYQTFFGLALALGLAMGGEQNRRRTADRGDIQSEVRIPESLV